MKKLCACGVFCALLCVVGLAPTLLRAQANATGTVAGLVADQSGAAIAGAEVTLTDTHTRLFRTLPTNTVGRYIFTNVFPGIYDITVKMKGFRQTSVAGQQVTVGQELNINLTLEVGAQTQTVEVKASPGAELQTMNSTMGTTLGGAAMLAMPSLNRDASTLLYTTATSQPNFNGAEGNIMAGGIAGRTSDQNTYILDGGNNTDDLSGDAGYVNGQSGAARGAVPTPIESIEEFKVNTNNTTADFSSSGGAQILMITKRGGNQFHGSAYDYFQSSVLNSDDWQNNFDGFTTPKSHSNRFGGSVGGPMLPNFLGGKTYFYVNYEGNRYPRAGPFTRTVPSALLQQGILQFKDAAGNIVQYNLKTSTQCGPAGGQLCDPRGIGLNPVVSQLWNQYEPAPNNFGANGACLGGDKLNTCNFVAGLAFPLKDDF